MGHSRVDFREQPHHPSYTNDTKSPANPIKILTPELHLVPRVSACTCRYLQISTSPLPGAPCQIPATLSSLEF